MKAFQVTRPRFFELIEIPVPQLPAEGEDRVLVQTAWASMCGSDIPFFTGNKRYRSYPLAPGAPMHECVGEVVASTSKKFRRGETSWRSRRETRDWPSFFWPKPQKPSR